MAAETLGIIAAIGSIIKTIASSCLLINEISAASDEVQRIAQLLETTDKMLQTLEEALKTVTWPPQFLKMWGPLAKDILKNIEETMKMLNRRLGDSKANAKKGGLSWWAKLKWPFERDETLDLKQHLHVYLQALSPLQTAFILMGAVKQSRQIFDEKCSLLRPLTLSGDSCSISSWSSASTVVPDDSVSQLGKYDDPPYKQQATGGYAQQSSGPLRYPSKHKWTDWQKPHTVSAQPYREKGLSFTVENFFYRTCNSGRCNMDNGQSLGSGKLTLALGTDKTSIWIVFAPYGFKGYESRWYPANPGSIFLFCDQDGCTCPMGREVMERITTSMFLHGNTPDVMEGEKGTDEDILVVFKSQREKQNCHTAFSDMIKTMAAIKSASRMTLR